MTILPDINAKRILLVESDYSVVEHVNEVLRDARYVVETAYNLGDALAVDQTRFAIAIVDSTMRDSDGRPVIDHLRSDPKFARLPILNLSDIPKKTDHSKTQYDGPQLVARVEQLVRIGKTTQPLPPAPKTTDQLDTPVAPPTPPKSAAPVAEKPTATLPDAVPIRRTGRLPIGADLVQTGALSDRIDALVAARKTLSDVGRSISSELDLSQVLNKVVDAATTLIGAEEGMILLPDEEDKQLYLRAMKGVEDAKAQNFRIRSDEALVMRVYRTGEPSLINDQGDTAVRLRTDYFVRSLLYVPLNYKGKTVGVLGVNNKRSGRTFTPTDQELIEDLAAHAAIAIENARLYEERLQQNRQLTLLVGAGMAVNSTLSLSDTLLTICRQVIKAIDVNGCVIQQREGDKLRTLARSWQSAWRAGRRPKIRLEARPMLKQAVEESAFYVVRRDLTAGKWKSEVAQLDKTGANQLVVITLRDVQSGRSIGALELYYRGNAPEISQEFRARVRAAAFAIYLMMPQNQEARPPVTVFAEAQRLLDSTGANWLVISLLAGSAADTLEKVLEFGAAAFIDAPHPELSESSCEMTASQEKPLNHSARENDLDASVRDLMNSYGAEGILGLPLPIKGTNFGTFSIYHTLESRRFRSDEINLAWALITQAATAIENARLYRDLQHSLNDLKQAQASLVQAARLSTIGELAAVVAHQINNPLTTVMVDAQILLEDLPSESQLRESVSAIYRAGQRAHTVVKRLLSTARRGKADEKPQWIDVNRTIRNTLDLVLAHIERGKITVEVALDESTALNVSAIPGYLEDVWLNLLLNGRDALANIPNATLGIKSHRAGKDAEVIVWDNGRGVPTDYLPHIFEPFFTTKPMGEGTGLGLHICKTVIEQCGGTIGVENKGGARFIVRLPLRLDPDTPPLPTMP